MGVQGKKGNNTMSSNMSNSYFRHTNLPIVATNCANFYALWCANAFWTVLRFAVVLRGCTKWKKLPSNSCRITVQDLPPTSLDLVVDHLNAQTTQNSLF